MLERVSLDQLRVFVTAVDKGSFSATARTLGRAPSVISDLIGNLEGQLGVSLFDRSGRYPKLTQAGGVLLADARAIVGSVDFMKARAKGISAGLEPELAAVIDILFPIDAITAAAKEFRERFPTTTLRIYVEALGGVLDAIIMGRATLGIVGPVPPIPPSMTVERVGEVDLVMVAAPHHPLGGMTGPISRTELAKHVQLVLTDRSELSNGRDFDVFSSSTWRLSDLYAKHAFLLNGLGWGGMPIHTVRDDLTSGRLVRLQIADAHGGQRPVVMSAVFATSAPPGPAGRWLVERLKLGAGAAPAA